MPLPRPQFPSEPQSRRLGTGASPARSERLQRTQLVIAILLAFTIVAALLYLLRRPSGSEHAEDEASAPSASALPPVPTIVRTRVTAPSKPVEKVKVAPVQRLKCGASSKLSAGEASLCDALPFFEQGMTQAVLDTADCAPKEKEEGTINYVVVVDFRSHDVRVYPGQSGSWRGKQAKSAAECVKRKLPPPAWDTITHQYRWYMLSLLATYPGTATEEGLPAFR